MTAFTYERDLDHPVTPGVDPKVLIQSGPAVRRALWAVGERRFPHLRYDFHVHQQVLRAEPR